MRVSRRALPGQLLASGWLQRGTKSPKVSQGWGDGACGRRDAQCGLRWGEPLASPAGRGESEPPLPPLAPQFSHSPKNTPVLERPLQPGWGGFLQAGGSPIAFVPFRPSPCL